MRMLAYTFETSLQFSEPVSDHSFVLRCLPKSTNTQKVMQAQVFTDPPVQLSEQMDGFGNRIASGYCPGEHGAFSFYASGLAMVEPDDTESTPGHPMFLQMTPLTAPSDAMRELAEEEAVAVGWGVSPATPERVEEAVLVQDAPVGAAPEPVEASLAAEKRVSSVNALVSRLCARVHEAFSYEPGATDTTTTAAEAFESGRGVCQDYAHVLISLCRLLGIQARYVTGLMVGEGASHAWVEVHDGVRWRGFDPTNNCSADDRYLLFATGRDFEDCPIERGVFRGSAEQVQTVSASVGDEASAVTCRD